VYFENFIFMVATPEYDMVATPEYDMVATPEYDIANNATC
jgi:hypothetical protein